MALHGGLRSIALRQEKCNEFKKRARAKRENNARKMSTGVFWVQMLEVGERTSYSHIAEALDLCYSVGGRPFQMLTPMQSRYGVSHSCLLWLRKGSRRL